MVGQGGGFQRNPLVAPWLWGRLVAGDTAAEEAQQIADCGIGFPYGLGLGSSSRGLRPGSEDWALRGRSEDQTIGPSGKGVRNSLEFRVCV